MANDADIPDVPEHKVIGVLGQGGMARVYLARDEPFDRLVALKVIDARFAGDEQFQRRFEREAKTAGGLSHPNIVPVHRYGFTADGRAYLTMAYIDGGTLKERLRKRGPLPVEEALRIARQIASALLAAHQRSVVHRDLKPDNVLFQGETAYLADFGIAKLLDSATELTSTGLNPGTVRYFSPEQAREQPVDARTDIYTLGIVLYEMLTARMPIEGDTVVQTIMRIVNSAPSPLPEALRGLQPFMDLLLAKDPVDRLGSCQDVVSIIDAMLRNWLRYADPDRLTDGIEMRPSRVGQAHVGPETQAETPLEPAPAITPVQLFPAANRTFSALAEDSSGFTNVSGPTLLEPTPEQDTTMPVTADAATILRPTVPPRQRKKVPFLAIGIAAVALVGGFLWWSLTQSAPLDVRPGAEDVDNATTAQSSTSTAAPIEDGQGQSPPKAVATTEGLEPTADDDLPSTLEIRVVPADARIVLLGRNERYRPGVRLPAGELRVRVEREGFATVEQSITLRPGNNHVELTLLASAATSSPETTGNPAIPLPNIPTNATTPKEGAPPPLPTRTGPRVVRRPGEVFREPLASGGEGPAMVVIPAGSFRMGGSGGDETPKHNVTIARPFVIGVYEVTFEDFDRFTDATGRRRVSDDGAGRGRVPVSNVSWSEAREYIAWLGAETGQPYRLPSEAEWEYVARAGGTATYGFGDRLEPGSANCRGCGGIAARRALPVGSFGANAFGVYDSHGNVSEWVEDCYAQSYAGARNDGVALVVRNCNARVFRGGSWFFDASAMRASKRSSFAAHNRSRDLGFRLARDQ